MPKLSAKQRQAGIKHGWRSGLEEAAAAQLDAAGIDYGYESETIEYTRPAKVHRYKPDFILPNGIIVETKGRFVTADRQKHLLIKADHPDLDIRFVFNNPNSRISKTSKTTYGMWCDKYGFLYAKAPTPAQLRKGAPVIPEEWLGED